ncbi:TPA: PRD domain-containing protein [Salmonella enterica subsp. enterica serovar Muenchen]|nr:PRD domain-containing protein [Salmonella enterica]EBR9313116.1 PRD domain-containing protein [Salmonella enterica subsp. enterica serovar Muenchen]ECJ4482683.1 PRD domain-containing protein [Salmonella enterica subsp. diarizonae]EBY3556157.1 PRD domain-containing protein [Salmonella enterica subsp. enterica serovar Muenchen]ECG0447060.1 PRD domain-containing protein [Salmonella enterica]
MEERLKLLCDAGVIDPDIRDGMLNVMNMLEKVWGISVRNEQGEMALTHMANALMRSRNGEEIAPLDNGLLSEMTSSSDWSQLSLIHQSMLDSFDVTIHPNEEGYLMVNLFSLWMERRG